MKLLLTSDGLTNKSINDAFLKLLGKNPKDLKVVFIPTSSNIIAKDRQWMIDEFLRLRKLGFEYIDMVDIAALSKEEWEPRFRDADVLLFGGGNPFYLKYWFKKSGLVDILPSLLKDKIYLGVSASSMIIAPDFLISPRRESKKYLEEGKETAGLRIVDFAVMPHYEVGIRDESTAAHIEKLVKKVNFPIYGLDDDSAIVVDGDKLEIISEGKWKKFG